jgi:YegS/Rv2252/BmrU family lipid kinase
MESVPPISRLVRLRRARRWLTSLDRALLRRATRAGHPTSDHVLRTLTQAANKSRLWLVIAAVLSLAGRSRGRRAAQRGLLAIGFTSTLVNGPLKYLWRRKRPVAELLDTRPSLIVMPKSFSFPSGHAASAFAFATGVVGEWPAVGVPIAGVAAAVGYSRVRTGVHYPSDVAVGAGLGVAAGLVAGRVLRDRPGIQLPGPGPGRVPQQAVLLHSPDSGSSDDLAEARAAIDEVGIEVLAEITVDKAHQLRDFLDRPEHDRPMVIAAGGDGTIGAAADEMAGTGAVLGIVPLGTSNDVARSLGIPAEATRAVRALGDGVIRAIDVGRLVVPGERPHYFVHAATVGFNVHFAELATSSALRRRFGRFTYAVAGVRAMREHEPFECELSYDGTSERVQLAQLSIINAPVFGGALDLRIPGARLDDRSLVVIAVELSHPFRLVLGALLTIVGRRGAAGVRAMRTKELHVHVERPVDVALDGEITGSLPADFEVAAEALRVVTPRLKDNRV